MSRGSLRLRGRTYKALSKSGRGSWARAAEGGGMRVGRVHMGIGVHVLYHCGVVLSRGFEDLWIAGI